MIGAAFEFLCASEFLVYSHFNRPNRNLALNNNKNRKNKANKEGEGG